MDKKDCYKRKKETIVQEEIIFKISVNYYRIYR